MAGALTPEMLALSSEGGTLADAILSVGGQPPSCLLSPPEGVTPYARNFTSSALMRSACVHSTPCGPPGSSTNCTFLIIFA